MSEVLEQRNYNLDFWAEAIGMRRLPGESNDDLSDRLKKAFGFTEEALTVLIKGNI